MAQTLTVDCEACQSLVLSKVWAAYPDAGTWQQGSGASAGTRAQETRLDLRWRRVSVSGGELVKVITTVLDNLRTGRWDCTCGQPHRSDGGCPLQDRLAADLATLGGWAPNPDDR